MLQHYSELLVYYRRMALRLLIGIVGGVILFSAFFLFISPIYTATAKVNLLPTDTELVFSQNFVRGASVNPANLMSQTHIENLLSLEISRETVDRLMAKMEASQAPAKTGAKAMLASGFKRVKNFVRRSYNILNSGKHVPLDAYTDTVLTLQDSILAEMIEGTYILEISVSWDSPEVAAAAANELADAYVARARKQADDAAVTLEKDLLKEISRSKGNTGDLEQRIEALRLARAAGFNVLRVIDPAMPPIYPSFPKIVMNTFLALGGAVAAILFALVTADTFSETIKTRRDLQRVTQGNALPTISRTRPLSPAEQDEIARLVRLRIDAGQGAGAVLSMGSDADAARLTGLLNQVLRQRGGNTATAIASSPALPTLVLRPVDRLSHAAARNSVADAPTRLREGAVDVSDAVNVTSLGGATESYAPSHETPDWLVVALRAGTVTEPELDAVIRSWTGRGVANVYSVLVKG